MGESLFNNNMSPLPSNFSAPTVSNMTRESVLEATANATLGTMLAFSKPVITLTEGRWVASTRCIPQARPNCANRIRLGSTSRPPDMIRSASSSTNNTR